MIEREIAVKSCDQPENESYLQELLGNIVVKSLGFIEGVVPHKHPEESLVHRALSLLAIVLERSEDLQNKVSFDTKFVTILLKFLYIEKEEGDRAQKYSSSDMRKIVFKLLRMLCTRSETATDIVFNTFLQRQRKGSWRLRDVKNWEMPPKFQVRAGTNYAGIKNLHSSTSF
jgi:hypothetical protein